MIAQQLNVLLVEDDAGDILMTREAFDGHPLDTALHVARDGHEAMNLLRAAGTGGAMPVPDVVLLDLNLPRKGGHEVLAEIRGEHTLTHLPVVVLTTSSAESDVLESYRLHANAFVTKPSGFNEFVGVVQGIRQFFGKLAHVPPRPASR